MTDIITRKRLRIGALTGLAMVFVSMIGMVESFNGRNVIDPILSLGYLALLWYPVLAGYQVTKQKKLEGVELKDAGLDNVVAGALVGLIGGALLGLFTIVVNAVNMREVFPKLSPTLIDLLTFHQSFAVGVVLIVVICTALGALGGAIHLMSAPHRRLVGAALEWVFVAALLEVVVTQMFRQVGLSAFGRSLYGNRGGISVVVAVVVALLAGYVAHRFTGGSTRIRGHYEGLDKPGKARFNLIAAGVIVVATIGLPFLFGSLVNELLANVGLFLLMALGLNIVIGYAGLLDLGYVAFFAVGAYTTAVLTSPFSPRWSPELSFWIVLPIVVLFAAIAGVLIGTPVIRLRGDYLAIVTLGFGEIIRILFLSDWLAPTFGGAQGITRVPGIDLGPLSIEGTNPQSVFYLVAVFVVIAAYVSWRLRESRVGRAWSAMREDEQVAEAMGINTMTSKLLAFVTGAILASFAGAVFAAKVGSVFPNSFKLLVSIIILVIVIVGGMGSIPGVAVGAVVLIGVLGGPTQPGLLQEFADFKLLIYGALLIYMMLQRPEGLIPSARRSRELHHDEMSQDAWLKSQDGADAAPAGAT